MLPETQADRVGVEGLVPSRKRFQAGFVVAILPGALGPERVEAAAKALGCDAFMAQQILRRPVPTFYAFPSEIVAAAFEGLLERAVVPYVHFDYAALDAIEEASVITKVELKEDGTIALWDPKELVMRGPLSEIRYAVAGRVEVQSVKEVLSVEHQLCDSEVYRRETSVESHGYDAFEILDLYGDFSRAPARLVEGVAVIAGAGFAKAARGASFTRLLAWLREKLPELPIDDHHRRVAGSSRRREVLPGGQTDVVGLGSHREVKATELTYNGQNWDEYSARSYLVHQRLRA